MSNEKQKKRKPIEKLKPLDNIMLYVEKCSLYDPDAPEPTQIYTDFDANSPLTYGVKATKTPPVTIDPNTPRTATPIRRMGYIPARGYEPKDYCACAPDIYCDIFASRYEKGEFDDLCDYQDFLDNATIRECADKLGLDMDKLWMFTLYAYDFAINQTVKGQPVYKTAWRQIKELHEYLENSEGKDIKIGRHSVLQSSVARHYVLNALVEYAENHEHDYRENVVLYNYPEVDNSGTHDRGSSFSACIAFFAYHMKLMLTFCAIKGKNICNWTKTKKRLVGQLIYLTKLSTKESWLVNPEDTLPAFIKQYKDAELGHRINNIYSE